MSIRRVFSDWRQPGLQAAAEYLRATFGRQANLDLSGVLMVVPGGRAGRRLLEILVALTDEQQLVFTPPEIVTPDRFPELLYQAKWPFADELTQQLAWTRALTQMSLAQLGPFLPHPPDPGDTPRWLAIAESLRKLHVELAADGLDCVRVSKSAVEVDGFAEHDRWKVLCELQRGYLDQLDRLKLWDVQTARLVAIQKREIATDKQVVLVGTVDLNRAQRLMLDQIADCVMAFVIAPPDWSDRFDEHGCLISARWTELELPLADEQIERVDGPAEQAEAVTRWLVSLDGRYSAEGIAIGLPDPKLSPQIERQLAQCGVASRWAIGKQLAETSPYRLLRVASDYAARRRFRDLAALVRHPDVFEWLGDQLPNSALVASDLLTALDDFAAKRFPAQLDAERLANEPEAAGVLAVFYAIESLIQPLAGEPQPLAAWVDALRLVLATTYGNRELDRHQPPERYMLAALESLHNALDGLSKVPPELQPTVDVRQACRLVLDALSDDGIAPPANPEAIELLGWLDLPLDDSRALAVTTFNEGFVPSAATSDAFLPNRLRQSLALMHNDRRLARDAYALSVLLASREELKLIVARRDAQGNPLAPSRLLFAADPDRVVTRARALFGDFPATPPRRNLLLPTGARAKSLFSLPLPKQLDKPITELSVTRFKDYLACPYRFYLRHMLDLAAVSDECEELDGAAFGDLTHVVLEQFGRAPDAKDVRMARDSKQITDYLDYKLDQISAARFGQHVRPAVRVQVEQIRLRLRAFAAWQAGRTRDGWRIVFSEDSENRQVLLAGFAVDGEPFTLRGRIDRIDYHEERQRLCVLDYKTADRGEAPQRTHRRGDNWIDLQLPLYRHLVQTATFGVQVTANTPVELGYLVLPLDLTAVGLMLADWNEDELRSADEQAPRGNSRAFREERFWPPTSPPPEFADDMAVICQDRRMGTWQGTQEGDAA